MQRLIPLFCLLALLLAVPASGGVVYVPVATGLTLGDVEYRTLVWASNHNTEILGVAEYYFIPTFADGTADRDFAEPTQVWMGAGESTVFAVPPGRGMLEILASPDVYIHARLVPAGEGPASGQGVNLPVVSSDNSVPEDQGTQLLGWERQQDGAAAFSSFGLINLGHTSTDCSVSAFRDDGQVVVEDVVLTFNPLSHNQFDNVLAILGQTEGSNWRVSVTCDQPFFPYLGVFYGETGRIVFVGPAASGQSLLQPPTGE